MSSFLTCSRGHRWPVVGNLQPDATQLVLVCPVCGLQPETIPPMDLTSGSAADDAADFSLAPDLPRTDVLDPPGDAVADEPAVQRDGKSSPSLARTHPPVTPTRLPAVQVQGYEILEEIGRGGMGVVYKARQEGLKRLVALKMILSAGHASSTELTRFLIEAEAVARLHHPNIVQIYQVGDQEGRPFLALEFVEGGSLAQRLGGSPIPPRHAAHLIIQLAHAMQHAHESGVVHRDLKPANILMGTTRGLTSGARTTESLTAPSGDGHGSGHPVTEPVSKDHQPHDLATQRAEKDSGAGIKLADSASAGKSLEPGKQKRGVTWRRDKGHKDEHWAVTTVPKITDFGLAKRLDSEAGETKSGAIMGTPSYMAPEQAGGKNKNVGPPADIYALGAILYELITGRPPFCGQSPIDTLMLATTEDPVPPSRLQPACPRDLETICLKCLEKEPAKRYDTAGDLARDLERLQSGEPILARPTSAFERTLKWSRRHPAAAALLVVCVVVLLGMIGAGSYYSAEQHMHAVQLGDALDSVEKQRDYAETQRDNAEKAAKLARNAAEAERVAKEKAENEQKRAESEKRRARRLLYDAHMALAHREWQVAHIDRVLQLLQEQNAADRIEFRGFEWYYLDGLCHSEVQTLSGGSGIIRSLSFSPDASLLVSASDNLLKEWADVRVWDLRTSEPIRSFPFHPGRVTSVAFHPGGKLIASAGMNNQLRPVVYIWNAKSGEIALSLEGHLGTIHDVTFSPDGKYLATAAHDKTVRVWALVGDDRGKPIFTFVSEANFNTVCFSADSKRLAASGLDEVVKIWDVSPGPKQAGDRILQILQGHVGNVLCVTFSPDGKRIATCGIDQTVRVWNAQSGAELVNLRLTARVNRVSFSPDSKVLAGADDRSMIKLWNAQTGNEIKVYRGHSGGINCLEFAPRGSLLASAGLDGNIRIWDTTRDQEAMTLRGHANIARAVFQPGTTRLASASHDKKIHIWDATTGRALYTWEGHSDAILSVAFDPKGMLLASAGRDKIVRIWDLHVANEAFNLPESRMAGALAAAGLHPLAPLPWVLTKPDTPQIVELLRGHEDDITSVAFAPDGKHLASAGLDKTIRIWNVTTGRESLRPLQHADPVNALAFSPDGTLLAGAMTDSKGKGIIVVWKLAGLDADSKPAGVVIELQGHSESITQVAFTRDGKHLASSSADGTVGIWDFSSTKPVAILHGHKGAVNSVAFSPDGHRMVTASDDFTVKLWDIADIRSPEETLTLPGHSQEVVSAEFSPDGKFLAAGGRDGVVKVWDARPRKGSAARGGGSAALE